LHNDLPVFLEIAKKIGFMTSVTTNCILFPERASQLAGKVDLLHFSLDADNRELHDKLHGVASFDKVIESISIAKKYRLTPDLLFSYSNENIDQFDGVAAIAEKNRIIVILDPIFSLSGPEVISPATHDKAKSWSKKKGVYLNSAHLKLRSLGGNHIREPQCKSVETVVVILPDNKLALPCYHHRSSCIEIDGKLSELLISSTRHEALQKQGAYAFCEYCHINCYFDPSYTHLRNDLFWLSLKSKLKYTVDKYFWYTNPLPTTILKTFFRKKSQ
jgi:MoaA/NifB/PqqE/SkfB family radical SAM enzyme